jgi:tRNA threonylcarbamoyladenosine biosynthesis protein TsaB
LSPPTATRQDRGVQPSLTGVRVGLAAAKGLAEAAGKRVVAISNLRALAFFGSAPSRATVIDARRGEVYAAVYNSRLELVMPEAVLRLEDWLPTLPKGAL